MEAEYNYMAMIRGFLRKARGYVRVLGWDEAMSVATLGMARAVKCFDPAKGPFPPYAWMTMRGELRAAIVKWRRRLPISALPFSSVEASSGLADHEAYDVQEPRMEAWEEAERAEYARDLLHCLPPRWRDILRRHYAGETQRAIAAQLGLSRQRVQQIITKSLGRLQCLSD